MKDGAQLTMSKPRGDRQDDLFHPALDQIINLGHHDFCVRWSPLPSAPNTTPRRRLTPARPLHATGNNGTTER
jgi:hypothetical protein